MEWIFEKEMEEVVEISLEEGGSLFVRLLENERGEVLLWISDLPHDPGTGPYAIVGLYRDEAESLIEALASSNPTDFGIFSFEETDEGHLTTIRYDDIGEEDTVHEEISFTLSEIEKCVLATVVKWFCEGAEIPFPEGYAKLIRPACQDESIAEPYIPAAHTQFPSLSVSERPGAERRRMFELMLEGRCEETVSLPKPKLKIAPEERIQEASEMSESESVE